MDAFSHECVKEGSCMESFALYETVTFCVVPYNIFCMDTPKGQSVLYFP